MNCKRIMLSLCIHDKKKGTSFCQTNKGKDLTYIAVTDNQPLYSLKIILQFSGITMHMGLRE